MLNKMELQGRLTRDPEMRYTKTGKGVCTFTIAQSEKYGEREEQLFQNCEAWGNQGEIVNKYFKKGQEIIVVGKLYTQKWTNKDGNTKKENKLKISEVHFPLSKSSNNNYNKNQTEGNYEDTDVEFSDLNEDDELPW